MSTSEPQLKPDVPPAELDERTRNRLLRAAVHIFDRKGYAATSVREIVELAGVAKPALYYHFGSKEGLLVAILEEGAREFRAAMSRAVERPGDTRQRLVALCEEVYGLFGQNVPVVRVAHSTFLGPAEGAPAFDFTVFDRSLLQATQRIVEDGLAAGEVRPASATNVALAVMGVIVACASRQLHAGLQPVDLEGLRRVLDLVFDGVLRERREQGERTQ